MLSLNTGDLSPAELQNYLQYAVAPRPVAFVSTVDKEGNVNLSPFSFFNLFSTSPPVCVFSPSRRVRDATTKHTLENILEVPQCVINIVTYDMVQQTSLASVEYPKGVNEFVKAGFTELPSQYVKPPRVCESPAQFECEIREIIPLGEGPGAGNLVVAEIKRIHLSEAILDENQRIDQQKLDLVARLGGDWYARANRDNLFKVPKPNRRIVIGYDSIPFPVRNSKVLTGNDLGQLANVSVLPSDEQIEAFLRRSPVIYILNAQKLSPDERQIKLHNYAKILINEGNIDDAWGALLLSLN